MDYAPVFDALGRDLRFLLYDVWEVERLCDQPRFADHDREDFDALLDAAITLARDVFAPSAAEHDANEPVLDGAHGVVLPESLGAAVSAYIEAGYLGASFPPDIGGLGLPYVVTQAMASAFHAANPSAVAYPFLTAAAANLLQTFGTDAQKARYLTPMLEGRFFGTMVLSEPEAGSSLADLRTRAIPQDDGTYHLVGDKMWISGGEHDLCETIVHLVLARIDGAPAGVKGISLFAVPRDHVNDDGTLGGRNGVVLTGLNHKMGYRGAVNTALSFGSDAPAVGTLVGAPHQGLRAMFHMMNEARTGVGMGATMIGYAGYRMSLAYARDRRQGRHPDQRDPSLPPVPIVEHADVRRMLLTQKVLVEGGLALGLYCARLIDEQHTAPEDDRQRLDDLLQVLTPIAKAWPSEHGPRANDLAIQVLGGAGYTRDWPIERYYRDNRLNPIHEGTNGIQGLDLLGRKVTMHGGRAFRVLLTEMAGAIARHRGPEALEPFCTALEAALQTVTETTMVLGQAAMEGKIRLFLANASEYLGMLGHVVVSWMWLEQAAAANRALQTGDSQHDRAFCEGKLHAARFWFRVELPRIERAATLLKSLDDTTLTMPDAGF